MKLQAPIRISTLRVDTTSAKYQQIAAAAMAKVDLVTNPALSPEQKALLYEIHIPELAGQHSGIQRQVTESGQIIDIVQDGNATRQTYTNSTNSNIPGTVGKREAVNGFLLDMV